MNVSSNYRLSSAALREINDACEILENQWENFETLKSAPDFRNLVVGFQSKAPDQFSHVKHELVKALIETDLRYRQVNKVATSRKVYIDMLLLEDESVLQNFDWKNLQDEDRTIDHELTRRPSTNGGSKPIDETQGIASLDTSDFVVANHGSESKDNSWPFLDQPIQPGDLGSLGDYRILKKIGSGGMGTVFLAEDTKLLRKVAIKVLHAVNDGSASESQQRFLREARAMAAIKSDHVVAVYQVGDHNGIAYLVMPVLRGETLGSRLNREQILSQQESLRIAKEIAVGLSHAHGLGQIHRDIKPENVWLEEPNSKVKILDFGLVRTEKDTLKTITGTVIGTPRYMSPEQVKGEKVNGTSDLFSLGTVLYQMLSGKPVFEGNSLHATLMAVSNCQYQSLSEKDLAIDPKLSAYVDELLSKDPRDRPSAAGSVVATLSSLTSSTVQVEPSPTISVHPARKAAGDSSGNLRSKIWAGVAFFGFLFLLSILVLKFRTKDGTVVVELDGNFEIKLIEINGNQVTFEHSGKNVEFSIDPGNHQLTLKTLSGDILKTNLDDERLTVYSGKNYRIRAWFESGPESKPDGMAEVAFPEGEVQMLVPAFPFKGGKAQYLGSLNLTGRSAGLYDLQPSIMYDADDLAQPFKMWWHGQTPEAKPDGAIYYAHSLDGQNWSDPTLVLKPQFASGEDDWADAHLIGSCSTIKINDTYYLFYEGVGGYVTPINRFFNLSEGDTWATHGTPQEAEVIDVENDSWERALGVAWIYPKAYSATDLSHPIYAGEITHADGKRDRFLSRKPVVARFDESGSRFSPMYDGDPVFHLFASDGGERGRKRIYEFFDPVHRNTYVTDDANGEGVAGALFKEFLGFAASDLDTIDMKHALQNQIMMATSTDGVNFTRFRGKGPGGSVISPLNPYTNQFNFSSTNENGLATHPFQGAVGSRLHWEIFSLHGSGFPAALVRDGHLELFFTDDSLETPPVPIVPQRMFRIPIDQIENSQAYLDAGPTREPVYYGTDLKWSPLFQRYFYTNIRVDPTNPNKWSPAVQWSAKFGNLSGVALSAFIEILPTSSSAPRGGGQGGLAGTPLGHTLDFPDAADPYTAFHLYYAASSPTLLLSDWKSKDFDHVSVIGYHNDFRFDGLVTVNGNEVRDGDTIEFGSVVLGQPETFEIVYTCRGNPNRFLITAKTTTTGDFTNNITPALEQADKTHSLTYEASEPGATTGTMTISIEPSKSELLPYSLTLNLVGRAEALGDINLDGAVNLLDFSFFVSILLTGNYQAHADIDQNGAVNLYDVLPFIQLLSGQ